MAPSFNPATMSVEQAADFVAMQAEVGGARRSRTKEAMAMPSLSGMTAGMGMPSLSGMSNPALGALIGGGLGAGAGLIGSWGDDEEKRKNWLSNMLTGGLLGAGVGGAAGFGWDAAKGLRNGGDPNQTRKNEILAEIEAKRQEIAKGRNVTDPVWNTVAENLPQLSQSPATPEQLAELTRLGYDTSQLKGVTLGDTASTLSEYVGRPGTLVTSAAGGTGLGHLYDRAARGPFNLDKVMGLSPEQIKSMPGGLSHELTRIQGDVNAARGLGGSAVPQTFRQRLMSRLTGSSAVPSYQLPGGAPTPVTTPQMWKSMKAPVMKTSPTGRLGKLTGFTLGTLATPFVSRMIEGDQPARPFVPPPRTR